MVVFEENEQNSPKLWKHFIPKKSGEKHKYKYGHAVIYAAPELTGATCLAATACARIGAGLVTVLAPDECVNIYRSILPSHIMTKTLEADVKGVTARLYGTGGCSIAPNFNNDEPVVLDADALQGLPKNSLGRIIVTPHEGEFKKAFPDIDGDSVHRVLAAAKQLNGIVVLKGRKTAVASPDGRIVHNHHASPWLATAGTGDVLAGILLGLIAQGMPLFEAGCAAVWIHGDCALRLGKYIVASDLEREIPEVLTSILD